jgi:hypothetical protein
MTVKVADAHAHVQKLASVVKTATVLEENSTEEQRSVARILWAKDTIQGIFINKCFL